MWPQYENKRIQKSRQIPRSCQSAENVRENEGDVDTNFGWCPLDDPQEQGWETGRTGGMRKDIDMTTRKRLVNNTEV